MEVIKKITIIAVLIASVMLIITFSPNIYEGIQTNIEDRQNKKRMEKLEAEDDAYWAEQDRLDSLEEARWNNLTQEEKCVEARLEFANYQVKARELKRDFGHTSWVDNNIEGMNKSLLRKKEKECSDN